MDATTANSVGDVEAAQKLAVAYRALQEEIAKVIIGQERVIEQVIIALLCRGHCLVQGVPGLAKTLLVSTLSQTLDLSFRRIQFTPDLMPSDITGTEILQEDPESGRRCFDFVKGPVFANLILADEINRTPPKTQAALLQAMAEQTVTVGSQTFALPDPFFVLATQNPIEQEGTYPLPEAQLDRFMFMVLVDYPPRADELEVLMRTTGAAPAGAGKVLDARQLVELSELVRRVPVGDHAYRYALDIVRATRPNPTSSAPDDVPASDFIRHWVSWGAGPRAGQFLVLAAKARALLRGRMHVMLDDIEAAAGPVLRHRIVPNFAAQAEGVTVDQIIDKVLTLVPRGLQGKADRLL